MQVTMGQHSGQLNYQVFPLGNGSEEQRSAHHSMVLESLVKSVWVATLAVDRSNSDKF